MHCLGDPCSSKQAPQKAEHLLEHPRLINDSCRILVLTGAGISCLAQSKKHLGGEGIYWRFKRKHLSCVFLKSFRLLFNNKSIFFTTNVTKSQPAAFFFTGVVFLNLFWKDFSMASLPTHPLRHRFRNPRLPWPRWAMDEESGRRGGFRHLRVLGG